jgi:hypothetical protein
LHEIACDVLSRRMALRIHNLLSEPLWRSRWTDDSRCRKSLRNPFLHPEHQESDLDKFD